MDAVLPAPFAEVQPAAEDERVPFEQGLAGEGPRRERERAGQANEPVLRRAIGGGVCSGCLSIFTSMTWLNRGNALRKQIAIASHRADVSRLIDASGNRARKAICSNAA